MKATLTVLGSGTSMGVPTIGCDCAVCTSDDPRDRRTRPSIMVQWDGHTVLIDTTPDFREQAIREHITRIDAILYTHGHADHILGLDDVRPLSFRRATGGKKIPLFATENTAQVLRHVFRYIFEGDYKYGGLAQVELQSVNGPIEIAAASFIPLTVNHGYYPIEAYRFGSAAYLTDFSSVPEETMRQLEDSTFCSWMRCATIHIPRTQASRNRLRSWSGSSPSARSSPTSRTTCRTSRPTPRFPPTSACRTTG